MSFEDWLNNFDQIQICNISPDSLKSARGGGGSSAQYKWNCIQYDGEWVVGRSAGGCGQGSSRNLFWTNVTIF
jgi:calpain